MTLFVMQRLQTCFAHIFYPIIETCIVGIFFTWNTNIDMHVVMIGRIISSLQLNKVMNLIAANIRVTQQEVIIYWLISVFVRLFKNI